MIRYIAKRLGISVLVLLLGSLLLFVLTINSGDPLEDLRESNAPNRANLIAQRINYMGLNQPWYERYWDWLSGASKCLVGQCDLGLDRKGQSVNAMVVTAAGSTLRLVVFATILAIIIGVTLGIVTAIRQYSGFDYAVTFMAFVFFSLPVFWFAVLLKHYAAIEFNNWIKEASFSPQSIVIIAALLAFVLMAAIGGEWKRRLINFAVAFVVFAGALFYFDAVTWFRRPSIGLPIFAIVALALAALIVGMTSGFANKNVRNAVATTAVAGIIGYALMRGTLMTNPSWLLLALCFLGAVAIALISGWFWGGFSRKQAMISSFIWSLIATLVAAGDLLLSNWSKYLKEIPRPVPTIGSETPNYDSTFWNHAIDSLTHIALPTVVLTLISIAAYTRYTRASMLDVLNQDYIRTARSKGISERKVITRHAFRNSLIPLATIVAFDFAGLIGGAVITETVFGWQGMGQLFNVGLNQVDPAPVMAFFLVTGTAAVLMNMLADIAYAFLDPRIAR
ncbi:ABC transporter permease [Tessaracoccus sp. MC1865]|uniref:ABC transporter permease n=1 Tax=unclassified Tessaracoccus TaxID=2635419 RepID=UPI001603458C|nr:ABC transporter permease [Tessaracoccus sp. MC1865]MBB1482261.1 ABC transporter permease [Tessaracoccus sp. MC1865]MBB1509506.1 ABC transporter permease [Tessaracoccus sp. MC1756]QTO38267.1 ABC transporter permease [Tessaracoccus sp. MC1865]